VPNLRLSVLDQSPVPEGYSEGDALRNTIDLARLADRLGYIRYWVAEHHGTPGLACHSPEAMIGPIAAATSRLRVGSGGIMLPNYSPLKVAETFSMLSGLFPGRIDLGVGRAAGGSPAVAFALQRDRRQAAPDDFREQLDELLSLLSNRPVDGGVFAQMASVRFTSPDVWLLGSSQDSAVWAAERGLPYVFAAFLHPHGELVARCYRERFCPSRLSGSPRIGVAVGAICAETDTEAERLSLSFRMMMKTRSGGQSGLVPTVERAVSFFADEGLAESQTAVDRQMITGTPARVREAIEAVTRDYGAEEVFIVNVMHDHGARKRSYELIAEEFGLGLEQDRRWGVG
jgi:luciferase family oxidoreductase group 1